MQQYSSAFTIAKSLQEELNSFSCINNDKKSSFVAPRDIFDQFVTDKELQKAVKKLYFDGHHARAVEEAYKFIDNLVKKVGKQEGNSLTGAKLMSTVLSGKTPIIKLNAGESVSEQDEQLGYMQIFTGCMIGIRNPRAHECNWEDNDRRALQLLIWANHLVERIRLSEIEDDES